MCTPQTKETTSVDIYHIFIMEEIELMKCNTNTVIKEYTIPVGGKESQ